MNTPLPCDPDDILSYEPMDGPPGQAGIRVFFKDGTETTFEGGDAERIVAVLGHVTPPNA
jgi:hypothetical protein